MAWLSRNSFTSSDFLQASDMNNLANDDRAWGGDVNGGGYTLNNVKLGATGGFQYYASPMEIVSAGDGSSRTQYDQTLGTAPNQTQSARWSAGKDTTAESGSNAGSNYTISRYSDAGVLIDTPFSINRASGLITMESQQWSGPVNGNGQTLSNVTISGYAADPTVNQGDMIARGASGLVNVPRSASNGYVLTYNLAANSVGWAAPAGGVPPTRMINTTAPMTGGGPLSGDLTLAVPVFVASGASAAAGLVPSPGASAGSARFLCENATWAAPPGSSPLTTKGDLFGYSTGNARVPVGTDGQVLTASSAAAAGVVWSTPTAGSSGGSVVATVHLTAQQANISTYTLLYTVPAGAGGMYRINALVVLTRAASTSSTLALANIQWTDADTNVTTSVNIGDTANTLNAVGTTNAVSGYPNVIVQNVKAGTNINYSTSAYASSGATAMQYSLVIEVEYLGAGAGIGAAYYVNGGLVAQQPAYNLIAGTGVTLSGVNNTGSNRVDVTVTAAGGGGTPASPTGSVQFNNAGAFGGSANLTWDSTNVRLGIGTSTPAYALDVNGNINAGASVAAHNGAITIGLTGSYYGLYSYGGPSLLYYGASGITPAVFVSSSGNVGIGTSAPLATVHSTGSVFVSGLGSYPTNSGAGLIFYYNNGASYAQSYDYGAAVLKPFYLQGNPVVMNPPGVAGNVGIGTVSPVSPLTVQNSGAATETCMSVQNTTTGVYGAAIGFRATDSSTTAVYTAGRIYGVFDSPTFPQARITIQCATGNETFQDVLTIKGSSVGIGTNAPFGQFHVAGGDYAYFTLNLNGGFPQTSASGASGLAIGWNYSAGQGETDFFNTYNTPSASFSFYQTTSASAAKLLATISNAGMTVFGNLNITGQYQVNGVPLSAGGVANQTAPSRVAGTVYRNTNSTPMFVAATTTLGAGQAARAYTDASTSPTFQVAFQGGAAATYALFFWVLPGNYYYVSSPGAINAWTEWY